MGRQDTRQEILELLRNSVDREPPQWLAQKIMAEVTTRPLPVAPRRRTFFMNDHSREPRAQQRMKIGSLAMLRSRGVSFARAFRGQDGRGRAPRDGFMASREELTPLLRPDFRIKKPPIGFSPLRLAGYMVVMALFFSLGLVTGKKTATKAVAVGTGAHPAALSQPEDARVNYFIGRGLLDGGYNRLALKYFTMAGRQAPGEVEFTHWQGVAYWALGDFDNERKSYLKALERRPDFVPSLLNLGHLYLQTGGYQQALAYYNEVLASDPQAPDALYNSALVHRLLGQEDRARTAFLYYLANYREGKWAQRAVAHLHGMGDYRYRLFRIGEKDLVINARALSANENPAQWQELLRIAAQLPLDPELELHIIAFVQGDSGQAKMTAQRIKQAVLRLTGADRPVVRTSWFDEPERVMQEGGDELQLTPSLLLFTKRQDFRNRRKTL